MKSGRLLKFQRPGGVVHVYLYREAGEARAALYLMGDPEEQSTPAHTVTGRTEEVVEAEARAWVDARFPRTS